MELNAAARRLRATLGFLQLKTHVPELWLLHEWADTWRGVGLIANGLVRQSFTLEFRQYPQGWRVNVRRAGADAILGSGWATAPRAAMRQAGWAAVERAGLDDGS